MLISRIFFVSLQKNLIPMKKITFIAVLFALSWQANAQNLERRNELKICPVHLIAGSLRIDYERLINDWSSVGATGLYSFANAFSDVDFGNRIRGQFLGFYRLYFGRREPASGFFLEGNLGVTVGTYYSLSFFHRPDPVNYTAFGAGVALGWKWYIPRSGIVLDLFVGGGRLFNDSEDGPNGFPRAGISVGKRF